MEGQEISTLVEKARMGDRAAFQGLYEHYVRRIYNFLYRMLGSAQEAEDLTQQTFLLVFQRLDTLRDVSQVESWIYRIARNEVYQKFRRKEPESLEQGGSGKRLEAVREGRLHGQPEVSLLNRELATAIQAALNSLPGKLREAFILAVIQGLSYQETAGIVGRSLLAVKTDVYRARLQLKEELKDYATWRSAAAGRDEKK